MKFCSRARTNAVLMWVVVWIGLALVPAWGQNQDYVLLQTIAPESEGDTQSIYPVPEFGYALSAAGRFLLIGKPRFIDVETVWRGGVELYHHQGHQWQFMLQSIETLDGFGGARCGHAVSMAALPQDKYWMQVGCPQASYVGGFNAGFVRQTHSSAGSVIDYGDSFDRFGSAIDSTALADGTLLTAIGAPGYNSPAKNYVEVLTPGASTSEYAATLTAGASNEGFGSSVSIAAGGPQCCPIWLAVGAPYWNNGRGKVYVYYFHRLDEEWKLATELFAPANPQPDDNFGASVLYYPGSNLLNPADDWLAIGAPSRKIDGSINASVATRGTVSVFRHGVQTGNFQHDGDVSFSQSVCTFEGSPEICEATNQHMSFGHALAVDRFGDLWIGAPLFDQGASPEVGRVYRAHRSQATPSLPIDGWWVRSMLSPGPLSDDCGFFGTALSGGHFGQAVAALDGADIAIAIGYPRRGCQALTIPPSPPGPRVGQVRIYGILDRLFSDRFED